MDLSQLTLRETYYLDAKIVNSPSDFVALVGKCSDYKAFDNYLIKLNSWCDKYCAFNKDKPMNVTRLRENASALVKYEEDTKKDDLLWKRAKIHSIDFVNGSIYCFLIDLGHLAEFKQDDIILDTPTFFNDFEPQAKKCRLNDAEPAQDYEDWSFESTEFFKLLIKQDDLTVNIIDKRALSPLSYYQYEYVVEVITKDGSILDILVSNAYAKMNRLQFINVDPKPALNPANKSKIDSISTIPNEGSTNMNTQNISTFSSTLNDEVFREEEDYSSQEEILTSNTNNNQEIEITNAISGGDFNSNDNHDEIIIEDDYSELNSINNTQQKQNPTTSNLNNDANNEEDDDDGFVLVIQNSPSNSNKNKNNYDNEVIECTTESKQPRIFRPANEKRIRPHYKTRPEFRVRDKNNNHNRNNMSYANNTRNGFNAASSTIDTEILENVDEVPSLYDCHTDPNDNRPILKPNAFIMSDDTIVTGYTPNVRIDERQLSKAIKYANVERFNNARGFPVTTPMPLPNLHRNYDKRIESVEERIHKIFNGANGTFNTVASKANEILQIYQENPNRYTSLIVQCIIKEMSSSNQIHEIGLNLLKYFKFCTKALFVKTFEEIFKEIFNDDLSTNLISDSKRKQMVDLLSDLYKYACKSDEFSFMSYLPNHCSSALEEWVTLYPNQDVSTHFYVRRMKCVKDFLSTSLNYFKHYDRKSFDVVYKNALHIALDSRAREEIRKEAILIINLYANEYSNMPTDENDLVGVREKPHSEPSKPNPFRDNSSHSYRKGYDRSMKRKSPESNSDRRFYQTDSD